MTMKRILTCLIAILLVAAMLVPMASCSKKPAHEKVTFEGNYTYTDSVSTLASNWNPHTYQTTDDSYPIDFISSGLYSFIFNDANHKVEGKDDFAGYVIVPEMAAADPVDITKDLTADQKAKYGIPADATKGYAYTIKLNQAAKWENGTVINADTYVYSMKQLLDPELQNYRSVDYMGASATLSIANGDNYFYQGQTAYLDNGISNGYEVADLVKGDDGVYYTADGNKMYIGLDYPLEWTGGDTLNDYVSAYGETYFVVDTWDQLMEDVDDNGLIPLTDESLELFTPVTTGNENWGETEDDLFNYFVEEKIYADNYDFANVGIEKKGDFEIALYLAKSLTGFNLFYALSGNWIVYQPYYDACKSKIGETDAWTSTYNSSIATTMSYGPYKLTGFTMDQSMTFEKNTNWYGYTDGKHTYIDPVDNKEYDMYQTTKITTQVVAESKTRKEMFLKGELMTYGLQTEDFDEYRSSDYCYVTPSETIFFFIFNGYMDAIQGRENNEGFDKSKYDLETMTLVNFRKAIAVTYDKEALCTAVSPSRSGGYGLIGNLYIYDPDTGARYRDTDQAKKALCDFYSVDVQGKFGGDLDKAVDSITGYDPTKAKELFGLAFTEALEKGYITSADGTHCDQTIEIEYASSASSDFITKTLNYLNEKLADVLVGTPFEGKINFKESAPLGNNWSSNIRNGLSDTVLGGWSGSALDPFSITSCYTNPSQQYDAKWFNSGSVSFTLNVNVADEDHDPKYEDVTLTLKQWSDALNGTPVTIDGKTYNFGAGMTDIDTRLNILAKIESTVLNTYDYIPMLQDAGMSLLTQKAYYVVEEYNAILGRGGITYLKYNYTDEAWKEYVASQENGILKY